MLFNSVSKFLEEKVDFDTSGNLRSQKTPNACAIIWNYKYRLGKNSYIDPKDDVLKISKKIILSKSIISIETSKSKGECCGNFSIYLAPNKNWISELTLGSWICILMTPNKKITRSQIEKADPSCVKFLGIIKSVSTQVATSSTGARATVFRVDGVDWATAFNEILYIDYPFNVSSPNTAFNYTVMMNSIAMSVSKNRENYSTNNNIKLVLKLWSSTLVEEATKISKDSNKNKVVIGEDGKAKVTVGSAATGYVQEATKYKNLYKTDLGNVKDTMVLEPTYCFSIPKEVSDYMSFSPGNLFKGDIDGSNAVVNYVDFMSGVLDGKGGYKDPGYYICKLWNPSQIFGLHTVWQLLYGVNATNIEELFNDLYLDNNSNQLRLTLFNRIMPFVLRDPSTLTRYKEDVKYGTFTNSLGAIKNEIGKKIEGAKKPIRGAKSLVNKQILDVDIKGNIGTFGDSAKKGFSERIVGQMASKFLDVPRTKINLVDIISVSASVSLDEKINIMEVVYSDPNNAFANIVNILKHSSQEYEDEEVFKRDGIRFKRFDVDYFVILNEEMKREEILKDLGFDKSGKELTSEITKQASEKANLFAKDTLSSLKKATDVSKYTGMVNNAVGKAGGLIGNKIPGFSNFKNSIESLTDAVDLDPAGLAKSFITPTKETEISPFSTATTNYVNGEISKIKSMDNFVVGWWSFLVLWKEWLFDIHKMINGTISIYGSDNYISVGTNILFPAVALFNSKNVNKFAESFKNIYILAHVFSVRNTFSVGSSGAKSYITKINFNRGVVVDSSVENVTYLDDVCLLDGVQSDLNTNNINITSYDNEIISGSSANNIIGTFIGESEEEQQ